MREIILICEDFTNVIKEIKCCTSCHSDIAGGYETYFDSKPELLKDTKYLKFSVSTCNFCQSDRDIKNLTRNEIAKILCSYRKRS